MKECDDNKLELIKQLWQENILQPSTEGDSGLSKMNILGDNDDEKMLRDIVKGVYGEELKKTMIDIASRERKYNTIQKNLPEIPGGKVITLNFNSSISIDPYEEIDSDNIDKTRKRKQLEQAYLFSLIASKEYKILKQDFNSLKKWCEKNDLDISDEELIKLMKICEESLDRLELVYK